MSESDVPTATESTYTPEPAEPEVKHKRKGGWPAGKKRGPRKPKVIEEPTQPPQQIPPTPAPAPPEPREPAISPQEAQGDAIPVTAGSVAAKLPRRSRKGRKSKTGVMVGRKFYLGTATKYEEPWLKVWRGDGSETWVRTDGVAVIATRGLAIYVERDAPTVPIKVPEPTSNSAPKPITTLRFDRLETNVPKSQALRDAELAAFRRRQNSELEASSAMPGGVPDSD